jgi:outer membrane protein assembly factor BamD (BamD/ComL family)
MSVSGISTTSTFAAANQNFLSKKAEIQKEFQQLGQDLQSGDLTAAQSDYVSLQQLVPKLASGSQSTSASQSATQSTDPRVQAFDQLEKNIQSGNVSAAQQDYSNIQQIFQNRAERFHHHHHVDTGAESTTESGSQTSSPSVSVSA